MSHTPEREADAAAYALGALDDRELDAFRRHLNSCVVCQADVESFEQMTTALPMAAPQFTAPRHLRRNIMAAVREDAQGRVLARTPAAPAQRWSPLPRLGPAFAGSALAVVLVLVVVVVGLTAGGTKSNVTPGKVRSQSARVFSASVGSGKVVITGGHAQLIVHQLTQLNRSHNYEVWLENAHGVYEPTNTLFNVSARGDDAVSIPGSLAGVKAVAVTEEPAAGSAVPTTLPVVSATIS